MALVGAGGEEIAWHGEGCIGWPAFQMHFDKDYGAITLLVSLFSRLVIRKLANTG